MANYNRFGAVYTQAVSMFPGTAAADFGGQTAIETIMDMVEAEIISNCNPWIRLALTTCVGALICSKPTDGQTVITVNTQGGLFYDCTSNWEIFIDYAGPEPPTKGYGYVNADGITVTEVATDTIRITLDADLALDETDFVVMNCDIDPTDSTFSLPTMANILLLGTAVMLGYQIYTADESPLIKKYQQLYENNLKDLKNVNYRLQKVPELFNRNECIYRGITPELFIGSIQV